MRLRTLNRAMTLAVSAGLAALPSLAGCHRQPVASSPSRPMVRPNPSENRPTSGPTTVATTVPTTDPAGPTTVATTLPATPPPDTVVVVPPATPPVVQPATLPATTLPATTLPAATEPVADELPPVKNAARPGLNDNPAIYQGDVALASRFNTAAELAIPAAGLTKQRGTLVFRSSAAWNDAAAELEFKRPGYMRLVAEAMGEIGDVQGEVDALFDVVQNRDVEDEFAAIRLLNLYLDRSEELADADFRKRLGTATGQIDYLNAVIGATGVRPNVRAHAAFRCAALYIERGQDVAADNMLGRAIRLNPASIEALRLRAARMPEGSTPAERFSVLLGLARANPTNPAFTGPVADVAAGAGLVQDSLPWYELTVDLTNAVRRPDPHYIGNWCAELYLADQRDDAARQASQLVQLSPGDSTGWYMQLLLARTAGDQAQYDKVLQQARNAMANRVADAVNRVADAAAAAAAGSTAAGGGGSTGGGGGGAAPGGNRATTRPLDSAGPAPLPDLGVTVAQLAQAKPPTTMPSGMPTTMPAGPGPADAMAAAKSEFVEATGDLAWLEIYFAKDVNAAAPLVAAVRGVLPEGDPFLVQLQGWSDLVAGRSDAARDQLEKVAAKNPLALLGTVRLMFDAGPGEKAMAQAKAQKLVQDNPSGLIGAMLFEALRGNRVKVSQGSQATALQQMLQTFPRQLLRDAARPAAMYNLDVLPFDQNRAVGDPLTASVRLTNLSGTDLTLGGDGVVRRDLRFEIHTSTLAPDAEPFVAYDKIAGPVVLRPGASTSQTVRLDQSDLLTHLLNHPVPSISVSASGYVNWRSALGQSRAPMGRSFVRQPLNFDTLNVARQDLQANDPGTRMSALDVLTTEIVLANAAPGGAAAAGNAAQVASDTDKVRGKRQDPVPAVAAWATRCDFEISLPRDQSNLAEDLADDPDWRHRQTALLVVPKLPPAARRGLLRKLTLDPQASVRAEATAMLALDELPPPPPIAPATAPAAP